MSDEYTTWYIDDFHEGKIAMPIVLCMILFFYAGVILFAVFFYL